MNAQLVKTLAQIIRTLSEEERELLNSDPGRINQRNERRTKQTACQLVEQASCLFNF